MIEHGIRWYVLRSKPYQEKQIAAHLGQRNIESYFPLFKAFRKYLGVGQRQVEPLFPCYLFARMDLALRWAEIQRLSGLRGLVRFGEYYPHLDSEWIAELRRRETPDGYIRVRPASRTMQHAQPVRIDGGLFAGQEGLFCRYLNAPERICILLQFLHSQAHVEVPAAQVRLLSASPAVAC